MSGGRDFLVLFGGLVLVGAGGLLVCVALAAIFDYVVVRATGCSPLARPDKDLVSAGIASEPRPGEGTRRANGSSIRADAPALIESARAADRVVAAEMRRRAGRA